jgi:hypothetical protein
VHVAGRTTAGAGYVNLSSAHGSSASAEFLSSRRHGRLRIAWDTVDVHGEYDHRTTKRWITVRYPNYMRYADAGAGVHEIHFELERLGGFHFDRVEISPGSGIALTEHSAYPKRLELSTANLTRAQPAVGRTMPVRLAVHNPDTRPARGVVVTIDPDSGTRLVGAEGHRHWDDIAPGATAERVVRIVPLRLGRHAIRLEAIANSGTSDGRLAFRVAPADRYSQHGGTPAWVWIGVGVGALGIATAGAERFRRSRGSAR